MIENDRQYLITCREEQRFARELARARWAVANEAVLGDAYFRALQSQHDDLCTELADYDRRTASDRVGTWMPTFTGRRFWLLDPRPEDIDIIDIAQGLSRISRYNGMTLGDTGYTVAQHCVLASRLVPRRHALAVLMHDAPETYAGDVITPLKELLGRVYQDIEDRIMAAVAARFGFVWDDPEVQESVKLADKLMLATEVRDLLPLGVIRVAPEPEPMMGHITVWSQEESRRTFLNRFSDLHQERQCPSTGPDTANSSPSSAPAGS